MTRRAFVVDLSPNTRAVVALKPSGQPFSVTLLRGREAFTLADNEARKLGEALLDRQEAA